MARLITILIPCYNEEECIKITHNRIVDVFNNLDYDYEILFINDGSKDNTLEIIKELYKNDNKHISYVNLARNYGKEIAMACGFDYALGDAVVIIDADLQHPPELIPEMLYYYEEGYDDIYGKRISRGGEKVL